MSRAAADPGTAYLLKVKTNAYRGGAVRDIYVRNSVITQTIRGIANFDYNYKEAVPIPDAFGMRGRPAQRRRGSTGFES